MFMVFVQADHIQTLSLLAFVCVVLREDYSLLVGTCGTKQSHV